MERWNPWWSKEDDITYLEWTRLEVKWVPKELERVSLEPFSLNFVSGPRQVGKTTMLKLLIRRLLKRKDPRSIFYVSCDELSDYRELGKILDSYLRARASWGMKISYIFLDEITFVDEWWRAVKARIDDGSLLGAVVTLTGSASLDLLRQKELFPGRRGEGVDVVMRPLGFRSYVGAFGNVEVRLAERLGEAARAIEANRIYQETLGALFSGYLESGGFPLAIGEKAKEGKITYRSKKALLDGLRGDWLRAGKSEKLMKEVIAYILRARGAPISWLGISKATSIGSPHTTRSYVEVLEDLMAALSLNLIEAGGRVIYRKNKKVHFADPFIYRVVSEYCGVDADEAAIVEGAVASHLARKHEVYYWRNKGEVDVVALENGEQHGIEVKWGLRLGARPRHMKKFLSLDRGTIPAFLASLPFG